VRSAVFSVGVLLGAMLVALVDVGHACLRMRVLPPPLLVVLAWVVGTGALAGATAPLLLAHRAARRALSPRQRVVAGALVAAALASLGLLVEDWPSIALGVRIAFTLGFTVAGPLFVLALARWPRLCKFAGLAVACLMLAWLETLPGRGKPWFRFVVDLTLLGAFGAVWETLRAGAISLRVAFCALAGLALAAPAGVLVPALRVVVFEYGAHARSLLTWATMLNPHGTTLGDVACAGAEKPRSAVVGGAPLSGAAKDADVLFVSFDAMRWDHAGTIPETWRELGPHAEFGRAVSPAPRTENSFASLLRGVPARLAGRRATARTRPTIAEVLAKRGYRTVQVPTHRYFGPGHWPNAGFELALTAEFPDTKYRRIVPAESALKKALELARETPKPLLLWVHLMEGHEPYRWNGGQGPFAPEGQRHAYRDLDARVAAFLRAYRESRPGRRVIIAVFGDHGEEFGEHGGTFHSTSVYAEQIRVAFALAAPGLVDARVDAPVSLASLPATVMDLLGLDAAQSFVEPSLLGCIGDRARCPGVAVSQMLVFGSYVGYTFERHRLLVDPEHDIVRLYDSTSDPLEQTDLAPSEPALVARLSERAARFDREHCVSEPEY
jgi:hypothetical protein